jgi:hypothetical protein
MAVEQEMNCPECGAPEVQCEPRYHEFLVKEFSDAGYGSVHHLTVATYMLQHSSKLSLQGWLETRRLLREFLIYHKAPAEIRRQNKDQVDSGKRAWKIASKDGTAKISRTVWTRTILDVRLDSPEIYCADVAAWAQAALTDSEEIDQEQHES